MPRDPIRYEVKTYHPSSHQTFVCRVFVASISHWDHVSKNGESSLHAALAATDLDPAIGLYFYRYKDLSIASAFTKIGEVSGEGGIAQRKKRGWLGTTTYSDTYLDKILESDVRAVTPANPMYFIFYEYSVEDSFPKIDELHAFEQHRAHFGCLPRNKEAPNRMPLLGRTLVFHSSAFDEVNNLRYPTGELYTV